MLAHRFPYPPNRGDRIRTYHLLKFVSQHFDVSLACPTHEPIKPEDYSHVDLMVSKLFVAEIGRITKYRRAALSAATGASLSEGFFSSPRLSKTIRAWNAAQPFDALLVVCSSMYRYRKLAKLCHVPTVVDLVDVDSQKWRQLAEESIGVMGHVYHLENKRTLRIEREIAQGADAIALTSTQEAELFRQCCGTEVAAHGIGNGVDTNYFRTNSERALRSSESLKIVFTGVMDYQPNVDGMVWFCREVWPQITSQISAALQIVGRNPTSAVIALGAIENVEVVGEVPDVRPYLDAADISISPLLLARGIQNKVLEALASGLATVVTPQSAEGIAAVSGIHLQIAADAEEFAESVVALARNQTARLQMGSLGRQFVEQNHSWDAQLAQFKQLLDHACSRAPAMAKH